MLKFKVTAKQTGRCTPRTVGNRTKLKKTENCAEDGIELTGPEYSVDSGLILEDLKQNLSDEKLKFQENNTKQTEDFTDSKQETSIDGTESGNDDEENAESDKAHPKQNETDEDTTVTNEDTQKELKVLSDNEDYLDSGSSLSEKYSALTRENPEQDQVDNAFLFGKSTYTRYISRSEEDLLQVTGNHGCSKLMSFNEDDSSGIHEAEDSEKLTDDSRDSSDSGVFHATFSTFKPSPVNHTDFTDTSAMPRKSKCVLLSDLGTVPPTLPGGYTEDQLQATCMQIFEDLEGNSSRESTMKNTRRKPHFDPGFHFNQDVMYQPEANPDSSSGIASDIVHNTSECHSSPTASSSYHKDSLSSGCSSAKPYKFRDYPTDHRSQRPEHRNHNMNKLLQHRYTPTSPAIYDYEGLDPYNISGLTVLPSMNDQRMSIPSPSHSLQDMECLKSPSKRKSKFCYFEAIPDDIIIQIFARLSSDNLCRCARVCRRWYHLVWDITLWRSIEIHNNNIDVDKALKVLTKRLSLDTPTVCVMVEKIDLSYCEQLTDKGLHVIARRCPELRQMVIQGCPNVTNISIFEMVSNCVSLEHLNVSGCVCITCICLTPEATVQASTYGKQVYLRYLDMSDCPALDDAGLQMIAAFCAQLTYLYLRRCSKLTDISVQYVANYCVNLRELSITDCHRITDFGIRELAKLGSNLRYLSIAKCDKISDLGMKHVIKYCRKIRYLNMRGCEAISDETIESIGQYSKRMKSLDVGKCDITDQGLKILGETCPQIKKLSLKSCEGITDQGIVYIAQNLRGLQQLNIQDCHLTLESYRTVRKHCKRCIIEHTNPGFF